MRLEAEFFDAAAGAGAAAPEVGLLVLDFDETLSVADSTSVVIATAIAEAERAAEGAACMQSSRTKCPISMPVPGQSACPRLRQ